MFESENFELGKQVITYGVNNAVRESEDFAKEVHEAMTRYCKGDWGDICEEDNEMNNEALSTGVRLFAAYPTCKEKFILLLNGIGLLQPYYLQTSIDV